MYNLPDEEFDRICREAADRPEASVPADGWDRLRGRLDREMPEQGERKRRWILWIPFFLSLPVALVFLKNNPRQPSDKLQSGLTQAGLVKQDHPARKKTVEILPYDDAATNHLPGAGGDRPFGHEIPETKSNRAYPGNKQVGVTASLATPVRGNAKPGAASEGTDIPSGQSPGNGLHRRRTVPEQSVPGENRDHQHSAPKLAMPDQTRNHQLPPPEIAMPDQTRGLVKQLQISPGPQAPLAGQVAISHDTASTPQQRAGKNRDAAAAVSGKGLSFSIVIGPDFSNVAFASPDRVGLNAGILLAYRMNKRWSVQAGALYARKHYTAIGDAYRGYPGYNPSNPALVMDEVEANCFMWDFPLNIRYDFLAHPKQRAFVSTGLSSYLMKKEDLHYFYKYNNTPRYKHWENNSPSMYWAAAMNISLGYEFRFTSAWSLSVEPFAKIPIRSIGYGKVDLNSFGFLAGIMYQPPWHHASKTKK